LWLWEQSLIIMGNMKEHSEIVFIPQGTTSSQLSFLLKDARAFNSPCKASQTQNKERNTLA